MRNRISVTFEHTSRAPKPPPPPRRAVAAEGAGRRRKPRSRRRPRGGEGRDRSAASVARNPLGARPSQAGRRGVDGPCARALLAAGATATATSSRRRPTPGFANGVVASVAGDEGPRPQFARSRPGLPLATVPALCLRQPGAVPPARHDGGAYAAIPPASPTPRGPPPYTPMYVPQGGYGPPHQPRRTCHHLQRSP